MKNDGCENELIMLHGRDRVVCVMTTGQEWQFRPYKWPEPKELFHHGTLTSQVSPFFRVSLILN